MMEEVSISKLKTLTGKDIKRLGSFDLTTDGQYIATVIAPRTDFIKDQLDGYAILSNSVEYLEE